jgi:hypothetical protein
MLQVGQGYETLATALLQRKTSFIVPPSTSTIHKKLSAELWITQKHIISKEFIEQVAKQSEELQINKELRIKNTIKTVLDEIADVIYKRNKAGNKSGSTMDLFKLVTQARPNEESGTMETLKQIHRELCDIIVNVLFWMEPTKDKFRSTGLSQQKFGIASFPFNKVSSSFIWYFTDFVILHLSCYLIYY